MQNANSELKSQEEARKKIALDFLRLLGEQKFKEGLHYFALDCVTHNPYIHGGMEALTDAMMDANREMRQQSPNEAFSIKHALADGDMVAVHTELLNSKDTPNEGGLRQVHLFRFQGDKIVEYWDISQMVPSNLPNTAGAF